MELYVTLAARLGIALSTLYTMLKTGKYQKVLSTIYGSVLVTRDLESM